jgi:YkoY family integral membrane protein
MDWALILEYGWVLLVLIALEGLLAADNALVIAVMVKHLPDEQRKKALFYGLAGAFVFRIGSLFIISFLVGVWQVQALGALYLLFVAVQHLIGKFIRGKQAQKAKAHNKKEGEEDTSKGSGFWVTVLKVELADIAFAVDSILAAVAFAVALPKIESLGNIGGMNGGHFIVILLGGIIGLVMMRFAAGIFVKLLDKRPGLESAAYLIVGWVGVKLAVYTMSHLEVIPKDFSHSLGWKLTFWVVLLGIAIGGWFLSAPSGKNQATNNA